MCAVTPEEGVSDHHLSRVLLISHFIPGEEGIEWLPRQCLSSLCSECKEEWVAMRQGRLWSSILWKETGIVEIVTKFWKTWLSHCLLALFLLFCSQNLPCFEPMPWTRFYQPLKGRASSFHLGRYYRLDCLPHCNRRQQRHQ